MRPVVRTIINADDLGMSEKVNLATFELMESRRVTSASILANGPCVEQALAHCGEFRACSFGAHLNITEFEPLSRSKDLAPLLGENGEFTQRPGHVYLGSRTRAAIAEEWSTQIEELRRGGIEVTHIDSHHYVHTLPPLLPVIKHIQHRFKIRRVRIALSVFPSADNATISRRAKKALWNIALRNWGRTATTDLMVDLCSFIDWARVIDRDCTAEIMVHPGHEEYESEERLLRGEWCRALPIELRKITYADL